MEIERLADTIVASRGDVCSTRSFLVGTSGIDGSGKGYVSSLLAEELEARGLRTAVTNVDGWLNLPDVRFDPADLPGNFYRYGIRFEEMFAQLILPLQEVRSIDLIADFTEEIASEYRQHNYRFDNIDVILLEGIFLFKKGFVRYFDLKIWIDCSFETALKRAIARSQEGLSREDTVRAYETIYFPAQRLHFDIDDPKSAADLIICNE